MNDGTEQKNRSGPLPLSRQLLLIWGALALAFVLLLCFLPKRDASPSGEQSVPEPAEEIAAPEPAPAEKAAEPPAGPLPEPPPPAETGLFGDRGFHDITFVHAGRGYTLALRSDGVVLYAGTPDTEASREVPRWSGIERLQIIPGEGIEYLVAYRGDGGVELASLGPGTNLLDLYDVSGWTGVEDLFLQETLCAALRDDGTVLAQAAKNIPEGEKARLDHAVEEASAWSGITQIGTDGARVIVGLMPDGTVVTTDEQELRDQGSYWNGTWGNPRGWTGVLKLISSPYGVYAPCKNSILLGKARSHGWRDITELLFAPDSLYGLRKDGTVAAFYYDDYREDPRLQQIETWKGIASLWLGDELSYLPIGLKKDGTVRAVTACTEWDPATGWNTGRKAPYGHWDFTGWTDITAICAGWCYTLGLRSDGTVLATGGEIAAWEATPLAPAIEEIRNWTDIAAICAAKDAPAGQIHFVALKTDGTLLAAGCSEYGQCDLEP